MLRNILVHVDATPENVSCQAEAIQFAAGYRGVLKGLFLRHVPPPMARDDNLGWELSTPGAPAVAYADPVQMTEYYQEFEHQEDAREKSAVQPFLNRANAAGIRASCEIRSGYLGDALQGVGRTADLVVMGHGFGESSVLLSEAGDMVRAEHRPFLLIGEEVRPFERVAVAYDGSTGSLRALALAADIAVNWINPIPEITLITVGKGDDLPHDAIQAARRYLEGYGLGCKSETITGEAATNIAHLATTLDIDLLCSGAYGHSLLRDLLLGSTTQAIIAAWHRPLLVCH
jgi:nucleotide-binding universal stress UspA family protein